MSITALTTTVAGLTGWQLVALLIVATFIGALFGYWLGLGKVKQVQSVLAEKVILEKIFGHVGYDVVGDNFWQKVPRHDVERWLKVNSIPIFYKDEKGGNV